MRQRNLHTICRVRVNHHTVLSKDLLNGFKAVGMGAATTFKTIKTCGFGETCVRRQIEEPSTAQVFTKDGFGFDRITLQQIKNKAFEVAGFGDVH